MAHVSNMANGVQSTHLCSRINNPRCPKPIKSLSFGLNLRDLGSSCGLNSKKCVFNPSIYGKIGVKLKVSASIATTEKPSTVPEIVLQPIKEISGTVKLPGSKSLSNRILLLAALAEVIWFSVYTFCVCLCV